MVSCFLDGPENIRLSSDVSKGGVILGQSVEISCTASSNPPPKFTIIQNGLTVLANSRHGILTISRFERNSSGYYSCIAKNEVGSLTVHGLKLINLERINSKYFVLSKILGAYIHYS